MAKLSVYLPPFASDYSGACSTLFGLDCLIIVIDAGCCTRNYVEYDELRWKRRRKSTFSAQLRTLDAVLGDDSRILDQVVEAVDALRPSCAALVGTPVPAIVGMDLDGMAREAQDRCGVPVIGLSTTGFETYEHGVSRALSVLCRRFAGFSLATNAETIAPKHSVCSRPLINVLGASTHDFMGEFSLNALRECLTDAGFDIAWSTAGDFTLEDIKTAAYADASLVVAWSGLATARMLYEQCGVPFAVGFPAGSEGVGAMINALRAACERKSAAASDRETPCFGDAAGNIAYGTAADGAHMPVLIVGEQIASNAIRNALRARFAHRGIYPSLCVASFFAMDDELRELDDKRLASEADLIHFAEQFPNFYCIGDPLLRRIPGFEHAVMLDAPHEAVSSTLFEKNALPLGNALDEALDKFVERCR